MKKFVTITLAAFGIALGTASAASGDEVGFIDAIASLDHYATGCPGCDQDALDVGYRACGAFDREGEQAAIDEVMRSYNGPDQTNAEYWATLFASYAAQELCPAHAGAIGPI